MKKLIVLLTLVAAASAYSQGTIIFNNRVTGVVDAPISYDGTGPAGFVAAAATKINGAGTIAGNPSGLDFGGKFAQAALYGGPTNAADADLVLLIPSVGFRSGAAAGYVNVGSAGSRTIDSVAPLGTGKFQVRAWDIGKLIDLGTGLTNCPSLSEAQKQSQYFWGQSTPLIIGPLGGGSPPATAPNMVGLQPFSMTYVPEPSIIGLGILGAVAGLLVFRRRN